MIVFSSRLLLLVLLLFSLEGGPEYELLLELLLEVVLGFLAEVKGALDFGNHIRLILSEVYALSGARLTIFFP